MLSVAILNVYNIFAWFRASGKYGMKAVKGGLVNNLSIPVGHNHIC